MKFSYNNEEYDYPESLKDITLGRMLQFEPMQGVDTHLQMFSFFTGIDLAEVIALFDHDRIEDIHNALFSGLEVTDKRIPSPNVTPQSKFTFNEFLVSKEATRQMEDNYWKALMYLCSIFLREPGEPFRDELTEDTELTLDVALQVGLFFEQFNDYIAKHFAVFKKTTSKGIDLTQHFNRYGWLSFLSYVAENGVVFYRSNGMTNLDNVKEANLYQVLAWSSERKEKEEAIADYYDSINK